MFGGQFRQSSFETPQDEIEPQAAVELCSLVGAEADCDIGNQFRGSELRILDCGDRPTIVFCQLPGDFGEMALAATARSDDDGSFVLLLEQEPQFEQRRLLGRSWKERFQTDGRAEGVRRSCQWFSYMGFRTSVAGFTGR